MVDRERLAREVLGEFTRTGDVGPLLDETSEEAGVVTLRFAATVPGYPGWHWSVSLAQLEDEEPTVLESELLPGDGALIAPDWVPWSERLEDWRAQQAAEAGTDAEDAAGDDEPDDDDESDESDESDDESDDDESDDDDDFGDDVYDGLDPEAAAALDDEDMSDDPAAEERS